MEESSEITSPGPADTASTVSPLLLNYQPASSHVEICPNNPGQDEVPMFMCAKCHMLFYSPSRLEDHITSDHLKGSFNENRDPFQDHADFNSHKCKKMSLNTFTCDKCSGSFKFLRNLSNHKKAHLKASRKKKDIHSCQSRSKMFAVGALKKHGQFDIKLKYNTGFKKTARKSMRRTRNYWCHVCNNMCTDMDEFKKHMDGHPKAKGNVLNRNSEKAQEKMHLSPSKLIKNCHSPTKNFISTKQARHLENFKHQVMKLEIKSEAISDCSQEQPILFDGNQISVGHAQSHYIGGMYNNFIQPVQQFSNMPNVQFISVSPSQNDLKIIPKFDFYSEKYMDWLKTFIHKCEKEKSPFSQLLVNQILHVDSDIFTAMFELKDKKEDHSYLMGLYNSLQTVMYNNVKHALTK